MKKILIIVASILLVGIVGFAAFALGSKSASNDVKLPPNQTTVDENAKPIVSLETTASSLLALEPTAAETLAEAEDSCEANTNIKLVSLPLSSTYDAFLAKAKELTSDDKAITIIEDNGDAEVNGMNINIIYNDGNALLLNFKDTTLTVTQVTDC